MNLGSTTPPLYRIGVEPVDAAYLGAVRVWFRFELTGLDGTIARIDTHETISYTAPTFPEEVKWSNQNTTGDLAEANYGTGTNPDPFDDADNGTLYLYARYGSLWISVSAPVRQISPVFDTNPTLTGTLAEDQTITANPGVLISGGPATNITRIEYRSTASGAAEGTLAQTINGLAATYTIQAADVGRYVRVYREFTNSGGTATFTGDWQGPLAAAAALPAFTWESIAAQNSGGTVAAVYTTSADATYEFVMFLGAEANPVATDFNGGGAPAYIDLGTAALTTTSANIDINIPDDLAGSYKFASLPIGGGNSDVKVSTAVTIDSTPASITGASFTPGTGTIAWAWTPNEAGTYRLSYWPTGTTLTESAIREGSGATQTVTGAGIASTEETGTFSTVSDGTWVPALYYLDSFGNETFNTYSGVTVASGAWNITEGDASATINDFPPVLTTPEWSVTAGDASATITAFPGQA